MNIEEIREYCLSKPGAFESFPFGEDTLVFKVISKMFALVNLNSGNSINLKCDPEKAIQLRDHYHYVIPGYHMSKVHWNTIHFDHAGESEIKEWIDDSYELVKNSLPRKEKEMLQNGFK